MNLLERIRSAMTTEITIPTGNTLRRNGRTRLAIPSAWPGGPDSLRSGHFGRCDCFTIVDIEQGKVRDITVVVNPPHVQGDCLAPVDLLRLKGANAIIVGGIGARPLNGFREAGMEVYLGAGESVSDSILQFIVNDLRPISAGDVCGGH